MKLDQTLSLCDTAVHCKHRSDPCQLAWQVNQIGKLDTQTRASRQTPASSSGR